MSAPAFVPNEGRRIPALVYRPVFWTHPPAAMFGGAWLGFWSGHGRGWERRRSINQRAAVQVATSGATKD